MENTNLTMKNVDVLNRVRFLDGLLVETKSDGERALRKFSGLLIYAINKNIKALQGAYKPCEDTLQQLREKYKATSEESLKLLSTEVTKELNKEFNEVLNEDVEVNIRKVNIEMLAPYDFDFNEIEMLDFMIEE